MVGMRYVLWDNKKTLAPDVLEELLRFVRRALAARDEEGKAP